MRVVFLGPPGSGKGTQAKLLASRLGVPAISTGEILRAAVLERKPLGLQAKAVMDTGELVSDDLMVALIEDRTQQADARDGFILDGFPRTLAQAGALEAMLNATGQSLSGVLNLSVPEPLLVDRMAGRAAAESRSDDVPATVRERLRVYREKTAPLVDYYRRRDLLADVDGVGTVDEVSDRIDQALRSVPVRRSALGSRA
ncbi:MAG TPA: adenylate kinase [Thermoanaerobaculia bacterium]|jgi:adenylate kinase